MANLNKVMQIGRIGADPEPIVINGVTKGARFRFCTNNRKFDQNKNDYVDDPCWIDVEAWNNGDKGMGDRVLNTLKKGAQIYIEGYLKHEEWDDKNGGGRRSKHKIVLQVFQYLDKKEDGAPSGGGQQRNGGRQGYAPRQAPASPGGYGGEYDDATAFDGGYNPPRHGSGSDEDIPF